MRFLLLQSVSVMLFLVVIIRPSISAFGTICTLRKGSGRF